jgi:hypothetical protein
MARSIGPGSRAAWYVVAAVGLLVIVLVFALGLFKRLDAADHVINDARPAFTAERVQGDVAGINIVSSVVDMADPITTPSGSAAREVPKLIAFVSQQTGLPPAQVLALLQKNFPHTTALLQAIPLSAVSAELPKLITFLSDTLGISQQQVLAALKQNFPGLAQSIAALPAVTSGWDQVPGTAGFTRFNGQPIRDVPAVRDYFADDVIPVFERQQQNFADTADPFPNLSVFPPLLLGVGVLVILYGALVARWARAELRKRSVPGSAAVRPPEPAAWPEEITVSGDGAGAPGVREPAKATVD